MRFWHFLILVLFLAQCSIEQHSEESKDKIKLLILSGRNNHEWQKTTPLLAKIYEESGYFETAAELKPLLHTWSLSVEEQYYVLFPLFMMALWKLR